MFICKNTFFFLSFFFLFFYFAFQAVFIYYIRVVPYSRNMLNVSFIKFCNEMGSFFQNDSKQSRSILVDGLGCLESFEREKNSLITEEI